MVLLAGAQFGMTFQVLGMNQAIPLKEAIGDGLPAVNQQVKHGVSIVCPEPCKELKIRLHPIMVGTIP